MLRADIGRDPLYRVTFGAQGLRRVEHITGGRVQEWVDRPTGTRVEYRHEASRRRLILDITRTERVEGFDASIWAR